MAIKPTIRWPDKEQKLIYNGVEFLLRPETEESDPSLVINHVNNSIEYNRHLLIARRFLSAATWKEDYGYEENFLTGGGLAVKVGRSSPFRRSTVGFQFFDLHETNNEKVYLALAFYREYKYLNNNAYKMLSLFKIINILAEGRREHKKLIEKYLDASDEKTKFRLSALNLDISEYPGYLYESCRCAIAHSYSTPLVDPELPEDLERISKDMPILEGIVKKIMMSEFQI